MPTPAEAQHAYEPPSAQPRLAWHVAAPPAYAPTECERPRRRLREPVMNRLLPLSRRARMWARCGSARPRGARPNRQLRLAAGGPRLSRPSAARRPLAPAQARPPRPAPGPVACLTSARDPREPDRPVQLRPVHSRHPEPATASQAPTPAQELTARRPREASERPRGSVKRAKSHRRAGRCESGETQADRGSHSGRWSCGCRGGRTGRPAPPCPKGRWRPPPAPPPRGRHG